MSKLFSVKSAFFFYILYFITIPFGFFTRILYSHTLNLTEFGIIYALYSFFGLFAMFSNLGFSGSLKYFIPKFNVKNQKTKIRNIFYYSLFLQQLLTLIFVLFFYFFSKFIANNYFHDINILIYFKIFILYFILLNLMTFLSDLLIAFKLNKHYQIIYFFNLFLIFVLSFISYYFNFSNKLFNYLIVIILIYFLSFISYFYFVFKKFKFIFKLPEFDKILFKEFFKYSLNIFASTIGLSLLLQIDVFIITYFLSLKFVGIYTNAVVIIDTLVITLSAISLILMPYFTEFKEKKDYKTLNSYLNLIYNLLIFIITPFSLIIFLFSKQILNIIFGKEFIIASSVLMLFSLFSIFKIILAYNLAFISSFGLANKLNKIIYPIAFLNLILDIILIKDYGLNGVAFATVFGWVLIAIFTLKIIMKEIKGFKIDFRKYFKIFILNIVFVFLVLFLKQFNFISNYYINSLIILFIAFIIYFYLGNLFKIYKIEELLIFIPNGKIKSKIKKIPKNYFSFLN